MAWIVRDKLFSKLCNLRSNESYLTGVNTACVCASSAFRKCYFQTTSCRNANKAEGDTNEQEVFSGRKNIDDVPLFLQLKHRSEPKETENNFPEISKLIKKVGSSRKEKPVSTRTAAVHFPYKTHGGIAIEDGKSNAVDLSEIRESSVSDSPVSNNDRFQQTVSNWIKFLEENNVEDIKDTDGLQPDLQELQEGAWRFNYGSPDPSVPPSNHKCGGCGSIIHCQDVTVPGYIPSEKFKNLSKYELMKVLCQRCVFMQEHNVALSVNVSNKHYTDIISKIKHKKALVLLLVDLTDFPCSIWPGIIDLIGKKCPVIVVGTKVDLLPKDDDKYLARIKAGLSQNLLDLGVDRGGNLLDVHLVSGKTYYGVENLINKIFQYWSCKGDVFLVGCTNVGKSTLFNALLQSDLCHIHAVDLIQRATTSIWPGTTLNLLKFPIRKMSGLSILYRSQRLGDLKRVLKEERLLRESMHGVTKDPKYATLMGRIEVTTKGCTSLNNPSQARTFCSPDDRRFSGSHFCYDTPGTVYTDQILDLLTVEELMKTLPKQMIVPRTLSIKGQKTLFLGGLARIDILHVQNLLNIYVTVFASDKLPVYIVPTEEADAFYSRNLGTKLKVPFGSPERLACFPKLQPHQFQCAGTRFDESCVDVVLSSAGWVSLTLRREELCQFLAYTPEGRGCYLRQPPLLPLAVRLPGKKTTGMPGQQE